MPSENQRQTTDKDQGGEGTVSFDGKSYDYLSTSATNKTVHYWY